MVTKAKIKIIADDIVNTVNKSQKLPERKDYNMRTCAWILGAFIQNPKGEIHAKKVNTANKYDGEYTHNILKWKQYTKLAKQLTDYIKKNGKLPPHLDYDGKKMRTKVYILGFANAVKYYFEHNNKFPAKQLFSKKPFNKPPVTFKKYGRSTEYGCDNRGQNNSYYCACHMAQEIVRNLTGVVIPQRTIAQVMGTNEDGTGHDGIDTFFAWFNKNYKEILDWEWKNFNDVGWDGLKKICQSDNQDNGIHENYRDTWGHYTNFDEIYGETIDVHNSLGDRCDGSCYCGYTENRDKSDARRYINGISQKSVLIVTRKA